MHQRSLWHPENALIVAVLLVGGATLVAGILMIAGVLGEGSPERLLPYGIALVALAVVAGVVVLAYSRKLRRQQRPEWLETQAWQQGLVEKLRQGQTPPSGTGTAREDSKGK